MFPKMIVVLAIMVLAFLASHGVESKPAPSNLDKKAEAVSPISAENAEVVVENPVEVTSDSADSEDRLNLNLNRGHAHAYGPHGSFSGSDVGTHSFEAGIRGPGGYRRPLASMAGGYGNSYSRGPYAPATWANGHSRFGQGNVNAGFHGGPGLAQTHSLNHHIEIPVDPVSGLVFYSNLKDKKKQQAVSAGDAELEGEPSSGTQEGQEKSLVPEKQ